MATPYDTVRLEVVASTQDVATEECAARHRPVLVVANRQIGGRGRSGREWWEAPRAMYSSLAVMPEWPVDRWGVLSLVAGLSVRRALDTHFAVAPGLKWPNDLVLDGTKVGGILAEASAPMVVVGCGVNLWWPEPPPGIGGVVEADPGPGAAETLARSWAEEFIARLDAGPEGWGIDEYRAASTTLGGTVSWTEASGVAQSGHAVDVTDRGALVVDGAIGRTELFAGEVREVRSATLPPDAR